MEQKGKVIIAGAGPGDPELITLKAVRYLRQADVILTDRLVAAEILETHARPAAEIIRVGKAGGATASIAQKSINELLVAFARQGKLVVRLKGGDVAFFSNVLDELQVLKEHGIPYEIIPGITAASGASACSGIPLTARGYADSVRLLTCFNKEHKPDAYWAELAATDDTLVFYMSGASLPSLIGKLNRFPAARDKTIAVIEQATTPFQQVRTYGMDTFPCTDLPPFVSPTLIIIGRVAGLHEQFGWQAGKEKNAYYFMQLDRENGKQSSKHKA